MELIVRTEGLEDIQNALVKAAPQLIASVLPAALAKGGAVFVERAKALAPVLAKATTEREPGELRDSITQLVTINEAKESGRSRIGPHYSDKPEQDPAVYALFVEFGTKNMAAEPFMRPAFDEGQEEAERVFMEEIRAALPQLEKS